MTPPEVLALARYWGGDGIEPPVQVVDGEWNFVSVDGLHYVVTAPGKPASDWFEDQLLPPVDAWTVQCSVDGSHIVVGLDGWYQDYASTVRVFDPQDLAAPG